MDSGAFKPDFGEGGIVFKKDADGWFVRGDLRKEGAGGELALGVVRVAGELGGGGASGHPGGEKAERKQGAGWIRGNDADADEKA